MSERHRYTGDRRRKVIDMGFFPRVVAQIRSYVLCHACSENGKLAGWRLRLPLLFPGAECVCVVLTTYIAPISRLDQGRTYVVCGTS